MLQKLGLFAFTTHNMNYFNLADASNFNYLGFCL